MSRPEGIVPILSQEKGAIETQSRAHVESYSSETTNMQFHESVQLRVDHIEVRRDRIVAYWREKSFNKSES